MEERITRPVSLQNGSLKKDKNRKGTKQGNHQMKKGAQKVVENGENTVDKTGKLSHAPQTNGDMELAIGKVFCLLYSFILQMFFQSVLFRADSSCHTTD